VRWRAPLTNPSAAPTLDGVGSRHWIGIAVAAGLWELFALSPQPSLTQGPWAHRTVSVLMDSVLAAQAGCSLVLLAWPARGWFLLDATRVASRSRSPLTTTGRR